MPIPASLTAPQELRKAQRIAHLLDSALGIPFTKLRFGLDSVLGLIPGLGDLATVGLSARIIQLAGKMNAPRTLRIAMVRNVILDFIIGLIPFIGDISDVFFKANRKNIRLLETWWVKTHHQDLKNQTQEHLAQWEEASKKQKYD